MFVGFYVNCPYLYEILTKFGFSQQFQRSPQYHILLNSIQLGPMSYVPRQTSGQMDRHDIANKCILYGYKSTKKGL